MRNTIINLAGVLIIILIVFYLINASKLRTIYPNLKAIQSVKIVKSSDDVEYSEFNLTAPKTVCSTKDLYDDSIPEIMFDKNTSIQNFLSDTASSLNCKLVLNNKGILEYKLNDQIVWVSNKPREHLQSTDLKVLLKFMAADTKWNSVYENEGFRLHVAPLAISSKTLNKVVWSFMSGWEAISSGGDIHIPNDLSYKNASNIVLISENRNFRSSLLSNSDIITINTQADPNNKYHRVAKVSGSLIRSYCR